MILICLVVDKDEVVCLVCILYGLKLLDICYVKEFEGYDDWNFYLKGMFLYYVDFVYDWFR